LTKVVDHESAEMPFLVWEFGFYELIRIMTNIDEQQRIVEKPHTQPLLSSLVPFHDSQFTLKTGHY
jgi:hypothetical protein